MAPHPPPCFPNERQWGNMCYPRIDAFRVQNAGADYKFILEEVPSDLLPVLAVKAGDQAELHVKKTGLSFEVTITSIPHEDASELLKQLGPADSSAKLPD